MDELKVDSNHKKIDASKIGQPLKRITSGLLGTVLGLSMYSGTLPKVNADEILNDKSIVFYENDDIENLDFGEDIQVCFSDDKTYMRVNGPNINFENLEKLKGAYNTVNVEFFINPGPDIDVIRILECIPKSTVNINFDPRTYRDIPYTFTHEQAEILNKLPNLESINFEVHEACSFGKNSVECMTNIKNMSFNVYADYNCDIDFKKLTFLDNLKLNGDIYSVPIWFNMDEYNTLVNNGVQVDMNSFISKYTKEEFLEISKKLDDIVSSLGVTKKSTDKEKLDAILIYVLENLEYDPEVAEANNKGIAHVDLTNSFYVDGPLYPIFNKNTAICGNYSALFEALADRLFDNPRDSYVVTNEIHAWNLVNIDGDLYYVDATWLDGDEEFIKDNDTDQLEWYMQEDFNYDLKYHNAIDTPYYMEEYIQNRKSNLVNSSNNKIKVKINNKIIVTTLGALVGCMVVMGLAFLVKKKKDYDLENDFVEINSENKNSHRL